MEDYYNNLKAFIALKEHVINFTEFVNGNRSFDALIIYSFNKKVLKENLRVTLNLTTNSFGLIQINDGKTLNSNIVHLEFEPKFQNYLFEKDFSFMIMGNSSRIGDYKVEIHEI